MSEQSERLKLLKLIKLMLPYVSQIVALFLVGGYSLACDPFEYELETFCCPKCPPGKTQDKFGLLQYFASLLTQRWRSDRQTNNNVLPSHLPATVKSLSISNVSMPAVKESRFWRALSWAGSLTSEVKMKQLNMNLFCGPAPSTGVAILLSCNRPQVRNPTANSQWKRGGLMRQNMKTIKK